ncbi:MAG: multifunctional CCA addition/repair protein [Pseudomonadota bacterium]
MEIYLVGGAVRDAFLDYPTEEQDWVVVGARPEQLLTLGYQQVGKDFPVFLHPETKQEYALARTERKLGHGYTGFSVDCDPSVTLEEDLKRRDLTINAMAQSQDGRLIDPYGGRADLEARKLRHVSDAFVEDPLRVLRTARFAARYHHLGFTVAPETLALMTDIVRQGELAHLPAERIWIETDRALGERHPEIYINLLRQCGALQALIPEVDALFGVPQPQQHHPEIDAGDHVLRALAASSRLNAPNESRFAVLLHDLGKGVTPSDGLPRHINHESAGLPLVEAVCKRLRAPALYRDIAVAVCGHHLLCHRAFELRGKTLLTLLESVDALRRPERFEAFLLACEADARGRLGREDGDYPQADYLRQALVAVQQVGAADIPQPAPQGKALGEAIRAERARRLEALRPGT